MDKKEIVKAISDMIFKPSNTKNEIILNLILENHFIPDNVVSYSGEDLSKYINDKIDNVFIENVNKNIEVVKNTENLIKWLK